MKGHGIGLFGRLSQYTVDGGLGHEAGITEMYFSQFWKLRVWDQGVGTAGFRRDPSSRLADSCRLAGPSGDEARERASSLVSLQSLVQVQLAGRQHAKLSCSSLSPGVCSNSWPESVSLLTRELIPSFGPTNMTSTNPNYLPNAPSPNTITLGIRTWTYTFGEDQISSP